MGMLRSAASDIATFSQPGMTLFIRTLWRAYLSANSLANPWSAARRTLICAYPAVARSRSIEEMLTIAPPPWAIMIGVTALSHAHGGEDVYVERLVPPSHPVYEWVRETVPINTVLTVTLGGVPLPWPMLFTTASIRP